MNVPDCIRTTYTPGASAPASGRAVWRPAAICPSASAATRRPSRPCTATDTAAVTGTLKDTVAVPAVGLEAASATVADALGREVVVLFDGAVTAGVETT